MPGPIDVAALAAELAMGVARDEGLWRHLFWQNHKTLILQLTNDAIPKVWISINQRFEALNAFPISFLHSPK